MKIYVGILIIISLMVVMVVFHETGHYAIAKKYDLNPKMHLFPLSEFKDFSLKSKAGYVTHDSSNNQAINKKISFGGLYAEIFFMFIIMSLVLINKIRNIEETEEATFSFILIAFCWTVLLGWLVAWNPFYQVQGTDAWLLFLGG